MDLFEQVSEDIKNAMKAKDKVALETLRNVKKFFLEAKTAPGANDTLTDADALKIMQKLVKQGKDSATIYVQQGRQDLADVELEQVKVIEVMFGPAEFYIRAENNGEDSYTINIMYNGEAAEFDDDELQQIYAYIGQEYKEVKLTDINIQSW